MKDLSLHAVRLPRWLAPALLAAIAVFCWNFAAIGEAYQASHAYELLGEGFLSGHTYLSLAPNAKLATLPDPYDPMQNYYYSMQDFSYYDHKYYLYFGPLPAFLWIAIKLITGIAVNDGILLVCFAAGGCFFLTWLVCKIAQRSSFALGWALLIALPPVVFGAWIPFLLREPYFYETAICAGLCCCAAGFLCLWQFLVTARKAWLLAASLCMGLAIASRPTYIFTCIPLALGLFHSARPRDRRFAAHAAYAFAPWALTIAALLAYNYERFGALFDFGHSYLLTVIGNVHNPNFKNFQAEHFFNRMYFYLLHPLPWRADFSFPFFASSAAQGPWQHTERYFNPLEPTYGILTNAPFVLFFPLMLIDRRFWRRWPASARIMALGMTVMSLSIFLFVLFYFFFTTRYAIDFETWWMTMAALYYLYALSAARTKQGRYALLALGILLSAYSVFTGVMAGYCSYTRCNLV